MTANTLSRLAALAIITSTASGCGELEDPMDIETMDGLSCWDLNENGMLDPVEDLDGDGMATVEDCRPAGGDGESPWMSAGAGAIVYNGNVGIGTMPMGDQLHVAGTVEASGFSINGVPLSTSSDTYWSADDSSNIYYTTGRVGIGTPVPNADLDVEGTVRVGGGNPGQDKVLTSLDAQGNAEWRDIPQGFEPQVMWVKGTTDALVNTTNWTDLDEMSVTMTTSGRPVVVQFHGNQDTNGDFRLTIDGEEKIVTSVNTNSLNYAATLPAGTHVFTIQWRRVGGSGEAINSLSNPAHSRTLMVMEI